MPRSPRPPGRTVGRVGPERARALRRRDVGAERGPDQRRPRRRGHSIARGRTAEGGGRPRRARGPRAHPVRGVPVGRRVRLGRVGPAPQDLPRPRRQVQPAARPDARHRAPLRPRVQRPGRPRRRAADRGGVRLGDRARRAPGAQAAAERPRALRDYGFAEDSIAEAADAILPSVPVSNPRPVTAEDLRALLRAAWSGADPVHAFD